MISSRMQPPDQSFESNGGLDEETCKLAQIENPYLEAEVQRAGNRMALENIRERLQLFFDAEARISIKAADGRYRVELELPYKIRPT